MRVIGIRGNNFRRSPHPVPAKLMHDFGLQSLDQSRAGKRNGTIPSAMQITDRINRILLEKLPWLVSFSTFSNTSRQNSFRVSRTHSAKFARGSTQVADLNRQGTPQDCQSFFRPSASGTPRESYGYPLLCARQRPNPAGHDLITATESITPTTTISWACEPIIQIGKGHLMRKPSPLM